MGVIGDTLRLILGRYARHPLVWRMFETLDSAQSAEYMLRHGKPTMWGSIENLRSNGFSPATIIDAGANIGGWTKSVSKIFPNVPVVMIEANPEYRDALAKTKADLLPQVVDFEIALLGPHAAPSRVFYVTPTGTGSSVLAEQTAFRKQEIVLPMQTLDAILARNRPQPYFLKLDLQGYESEVLRGAKQTLQGTEVILTELALLEYNKNAKLIAELMSLLHESSFLLYDICGLMRRESDQALYHIDAIFVRDGSQLRAPRYFWADELGLDR